MSASPTSSAQVFHLRKNAVECDEAGLRIRGIPLFDTKHFRGKPAEFVAPGLVELKKKAGHRVPFSVQWSRQDSRLGGCRTGAKLG